MARLPIRRSELTVTQAALENATGGLRAAFKERSQRDADSLVRVVSSMAEDFLTEAYKAGLRDGFVQGADAQARFGEARRRAVDAALEVDSQWSAGRLLTAIEEAREALDG